MPRLKNRTKVPFKQSAFYGENLRAWDDEAHPYEASIAENVIYSRGAKPQVRPGRHKINGTSLASKIVSFAYYKNSVSEQNFFIDTADMKTRVDDNLDGDYGISWFPNTTGEPYMSVQMRDQLFRGNGTDMKRWNGSGFMDWFRPGPNIETLLLKALDTGVLDGVYAYRFSFYRTETIAGTSWTFESKCSFASAEVTATNQQIRIRSLPTTSLYWTGLRIYRKGGNSPDWLLLTSFLQAAVPDQYFDNIAEEDLGALMECGGNAPPPPGKTVVAVKNQIVITRIPQHPLRFAFNKAGYPLYFPDEDYDYPHFEDVEESDGQPITAAFPALDGVLIFKKTKTYYYPFNNVPYEFQRVDISRSIGCIAQDSIVENNGKIYWLGIDGYYCFDTYAGSAPERISWAVDIDDNGGMGETSIVYKYSSPAVYDYQGDSVWLSMVQRETGTHSRTWAYNLRLPKQVVAELSDGTNVEKYISRWTHHSFGFSACIRIADQSNRLITGDEDGYYWAEQVQDKDDTELVVMDYATAWRNYDHQFDDKQITSQMVACYLMEDVALSIKTQADFFGQEDSYTITLDGARYGTAVFGVDYWSQGYGYVEKLTPMPQYIIGDYIRTRFTGPGVRITRLEQVIALRKKRMQS